MKELRRFKRVPFREAFHFQQEKGLLSGDCVAVDLSEGGVQLKAEEFFPLNAPVVLSFRLEASVLRLEGRVAWIQRVPHAEIYRAGMEFLDNDRNRIQLKRIRSYISN